MTGLRDRLLCGLIYRVERERHQLAGSSGCPITDNLERKAHT
jgi:hypothetical protein